jgi:PAS domain S-box-containing protein
VADPDDETVGPPGVAELLEETADELYDQAPCGYLSTLPDGTIVKVNGTFLRWTGYERDELVGRKRLLDLLAPGDRIFYETHYAPLLRLQGEVHEIAVEIVSADGRRLPALVNATVRNDDAGAPRVVRTTVLDATDRRAYERELVRARREAESRATAGLALAHVGDGILLVGEDGRVALLNAAAEAILGVAAEDALGGAAESLPGWTELLARAPVGDRGRTPSPVVLPLERSGSDLWVSVVGVDSGQGIVYTLRDVTDERALDRLRSEVIATVSHELRTPLAAAYGAALTLRDRDAALDPETRAMLLTMMVDQGERLARIVDEILLATALEQGGMSAAPTAFDGAALAARVGAAFRVSCAAVAVDVEEAVRVRADEARTEQVLVNLVENAVRYSPAGAPVRLTVGSTGSRARFVVSDEGPGIPAGQEERIFGKFVRLDPDQRSGIGGLGLDLYIARELVGRMGGQIEALPSTQGAAFAVDLPLADPAAA